MAANRAFVVPNSNTPLSTNPSPPRIVLSVLYYVLDSNDNLVTTLTSLNISLGYSQLNNVASAIQSAVQVQQNDSSLQVYIF